MKQAIKYLAKLLGLLVLTAATLYALLIIVYLLPIGRIQSHVSDAETYSIFAVERNYPHIVSAMREDSVLEDYTDAWMLLIASCDSNEPFYKAALLNEREYYNEGEAAPAENVMFMNYGYDSLGQREYARYWHAYLIFLKPLLLIFNYAQIRYILMAVDLGLLVLVIKAMSESKNAKARHMVFPLLVAVLYINLTVVSLSIMYSNCFIVTLAALAVMLKYYDKLDFNIFFMFVGIATSAMDLLTYPTITFGIPMATLVVLMSGTFKDKFIRFFKSGMAWCFGYLGIWLLKWIISSIVLGKNMVAEGLEAVLVRTEGVEDSAFDVIMGVLKMKPEFLKIVLVIAIVIFAVNLYKHGRPDLATLAMLAIVFLVPFAWSAIVRNHTIVHVRFTHRLLATAIYSGLLGACGTFADGIRNDGINT